MTFELLAALIAAVACGALAHMARRIFKERMPKWSMAVAAAVGLIGTTIYLEYDWFNRVSAALPEGVRVVVHEEEVMALRPWTILAPITTQFVAMDVGQMAQHPRNADLRMARIFNFGRWRPVADTLMIFDCAQSRQVLLSEGVEITEQGQLTGADWTVVDASDRLQTAACAAS